MLMSVIFIVLFVLGILEMLLYPKTNGKLNAVKVIVMGTMAIFCYLTLAAFVFHKLHIGINIKTTCISLLVMDVFFAIGILYKKKIQALFIRPFDVMNIIIIAVFVLFVSNHIFSMDLALQYRNGDAASHFLSAMDIVRTGQIGNIYFSAFIDAVFIELFAPFLAAVQYYKAFIIADIFMHVLEACMFYVLVITISNRKIVRYMGALLSIGYFWGYPAYSFMVGNFVYWSNGVMILMFIIYALILLERHAGMMTYSGILLALGLYANLCCNKLFIPLNTLAVFAVLFILILQKRKLIVNKKVFIGVVLGLAAVVAVALFFYQKIWGSTLKNIFDTISGVGGIYRSMYADLIFFLPVLILLCIYVLTKKYHSKIILIISSYMILCTIAMYILWYHSLMSTYYYYKIYYNLWLMGWLVCVVVLDIMEENRQLTAAFSYMGMIGVMTVIALSNYDSLMTEHNESYNGEYATSQLLPLYRYNMDSMITDYASFQLSAKKLDVFNYSIQQYSGEAIPMVLSDYIELLWYDALSGCHSEGYRIETYEFPDVLPLLDAAGIKKIMVTKDHEDYQIYQKYFESCREVYGNDEISILEPKGNSWSDVASIDPDYSVEKMGLFMYVGNSLEAELVPLMAEKSSYLDFSMYYNLAGKISNGFYTWKEDFDQTIENLNANHVKYIVLLKEDGFYKNNQSYFDAMELIYENEAGKVVKCIGNEWPDVELPAKKLDVYHYAMEQYSGETIPMILSNQQDFLWYDALSGSYSQGYRIETYEFAEVLPLLDATGIKKIIVTKDCEEYQLYQKYFDSCREVYGNDEISILEPVGSSWSDIAAVDPNYSAEKVGLFNYVKNSLEEEQVPLMAEKTAYLDFSMYYNQAGRSSSGFYTWKEDFNETLINLNANHVKYIMLLKEDGFYRSNQSYFDAMETIYENEAGKVVKCVGDEWPSSEISN